MGDHYYSTGGWGEHANICPEDETDFSGTYRCAKNYDCGDCYNCDKEFGRIEICHNSRLDRKEVNKPTYKDVW